MTTSRNFLLVHGAAHGAWCWSRVIPLLRQRGHGVQTIDLPGRAGNGSPGWRLTLDDYAGALANRLRQEQQPAVVVGHSMGGQVISAAAELVPGKFERLVYVAAFLPRSGESMVSLGKEDAASELPRATKNSIFRGVFTIKPEALAPVFYGDCTREDVAWVQQRLVAESVRPAFGKIRLSPGGFGSVPRSYIRCTEDRTLSIQLQDLMIARQGCEHVATLKSSHSPFISMPEQLVEAILQVA